MLVPNWSGGDVALCCTAAAGVSSLREVSLKLSELERISTHGGAHDRLPPCRSVSRLSSRARLYPGMIATKTTRTVQGGTMYDAGFWQWIFAHQFSIYLR